MSRIVAAVLALMGAALPAAASWGDARLWNDGRAEVAVYDAQRVVYDKPRKFRETLIVVKEDLRLDTLVKADRPKDVRTEKVFKLNQVQNFDTENYAYHYLTSVFSPVDDPAAVIKLTVGSQEACGNTFKMFTAPKGAAATLLWHSYFDGEADRTVPLDVQPGDFFDDGLPLALRALPLEEGFELKGRVWDNLTSNRGVEPRAVPAVIKVVGEETVRCRAGSIPSWKVTVERDGGAVDTYWFEKKQPRILTRMEKADGSARVLHGRARWSYWDRRIPRPNVLK